MLIGPTKRDLAGVEVSLPYHRRICATAKAFARRVRKMDVRLSFLVVWSPHTISSCVSGAFIGITLGPPMVEVGISGSA